jgi:hypothetical protein
MKLKSVELDLTALMSEVMFGHGYAHYGYFPDGVPEVLSAAALGASTARLFRAAGTGDRVGSGRRQAHPRCRVGNGGQCAGVDRARLRGGLRVAVGADERDGAHQAAGRDRGHGRDVRGFRREARFDICLFAESFHYIDLEAGCGRRRAMRKRVS